MTSETPESPWTFTRVPGGYESKCENLGITITAEEIKRKADEMTAFTTIRSTMVGVRTVEDDIVKIGVLNFYAPTSRATWAKEAKLRCGGETSDLGFVSLPQTGRSLRESSVDLPSERYPLRRRRVAK